MPEQRIFRPRLLDRIFRRPRDAPVTDRVQPTVRDTAPEGSRAASRTLGDLHLMGSEMIYSAVARVSNTVALMPMHLYRGDSIDTQHPLNRLISYAPGPRYHAFEWRRTMQANATDAGRAYSIIRRAADGVTILNLQQVDPQRVWEIVTPTDEVWYRVQWDDRVEYLPSCDVFALRGVSHNGVRGISQHAVLGGALEYDRRIKRYSLEQMDSVNGTIVITVPNTGLSAARQEEVVKEFLSVYKGSGGKAVILQGGMTANALSNSPIDTELAEVEKATANRIATVNLVPPHMLGDHSDTSYATAEQEMLEFQQMTLLSWVTQWEAEADAKLLTWQMICEGWHFVMDMRVLQRADVLTMANRHSIGVRSGNLTINEARREDNLPPVEGGDIPLISRDLVPLDIAIEQARQAAAAQKGVTTHARKRK